MPEDVETFKHMKFIGDSFSVSTDDNGDVLVDIKRYCYRDLIFRTEVVEVGGIRKIDSKATIKNLFEVASVNSDPIKKYCYDFDSSELTGKINGQEWTIKKVDARLVDWGSKNTIYTSLHPEDCEAEYTGDCVLPRLIVSNLNLKGDGGNFSASENITIHTPPSDNQVISAGSYRITHLSDKKQNWKSVLNMMIKII